MDSEPWPTFGLLSFVVPHAHTPNTTFPQCRRAGLTRQILSPKATPRVATTNLFPPIIRDAVNERAVHGHM